MHRPGLVGAGMLLGVITLACLIGPLFTRAYDAIDRDAIALGPSLAFPFGTDANGRDLLARVLMGGRVSLGAGLLASTVALVIGGLYGAVSGYAGERADALMMRLVDILYALPLFFLIILLIVVFGRRLVLVFVAIGAIEWLDMARIVRGQTMALKQRDFVHAARALGVSPTGILRRHIAPNLAGGIVVTLTIIAPRIMLIESALSFIGLGVQEPMTSWGALIADGARQIQSAPSTLLIPAAFLTATLLAFNVLGDALRDALDPRDA